MAWIEQKGSGFLVRRRDYRGRTISQYFTTRAAAEKDRDFWNEEAEADRLQKRILRRSTPPADRRFIGTVTEGRPLAVYLRTIIEADTELRQASRETYLAGFRHHIEGTKLGRTEIGRASCRERV